MTTKLSDFIRQKHRRLLRLIAGDTSHDGTSQQHLRVRNSLATTPVPFTLTGVDWCGGATVRGGGDATAKDDSKGELRSSHSSGCPSY